jgi:glutamine synthetase
MGYGVEVLHLAIPDTSGTLRQKRFPVERAARLWRDGWSFIDAIQWWDPADGVAAHRGWVQEPADVDPSSLRAFPFEDHAAVALADFTGPLGELSPRAVLRRLVDRALGQGLVARLAFEIEVIILRETADALAAGGHRVLRAEASANRCWSALTPATHGELLAGLDATLAAGGVPLDHLCSELGPGCLELATAPAGPVEAADDLAFLKLYTKAFCHLRGGTASFMAKLSEDFPGLGGHPVLSLHDARTGRDVLAGDPLSTVGERAVAGIVRSLPELTLLAAPTTNSYRRLAPGNWAPRTATWGIGNYTCGLRVVRPRAGATRLELRVPGADVNPWLAAVLALGGALWGIERELHPPPPVDGPAREVSHEGIGELPRTLREAALRFAGSATARELCGDSFVDHYAATRIEEDRVVGLHVPAHERARYLSQV